MGFFFDSDYEIMLKNEIKSYRKQTEIIIKDADEYKKKYKKRKRKAENEAKGLNIKIKDHAIYKAELLKELTGDIADNITKFKEFDIDSRIIKNPEFKNTDTSESFSLNSIGLSCDSIMPDLVPKFSLFDLFETENLEEKVELEKDNYNKALEYMIMIKNASKEMKQKYLQLQNVSKFIEDEHSILEELMNKLRPQIEFIKQIMEKKIFSKEEADYAKNIVGIIELLKNSLQARIIDGEGYIESNYKQYYENLFKNIERLPSKPNIEHYTTMDKMRMLLDIPYKV